MAYFSYKAKAGPHEFKNGILQAENKAAVIKKLKDDGLFAVSIEEAIPPATLNVRKRITKITSRDIAVFTRQLANLTHSGFTLDAALATLAEQEQSQNLRKLIAQLQEKIQKGQAFSSALKEHNDIFSSFYINMVAIGETSGKIDETLTRLADFKEKETEISGQVKSATVYPAFLLVVGSLSIFVMIAFFIPRFANMFSSYGQILPLPTRIVIKLSALLRSFWWVIAVIVAALWQLARNYFRSDEHKVTLDKFLLQLPLIKNLVQQFELARLSYALGLLLKSGVTMLESVKVAAQSVHNQYLRKSLAGFEEHIRKGHTLSDCLKGAKIFPTVLINTVAVGEESGELAEMLLKLAVLFENEGNRLVKTSVTLIEPTLILIIGGIVIGLIVFSILLPIYQINTLVR